MEHARIAYFDDEPTKLPEIMEIYGHLVVTAAVTPEEAEGIIDSIASGETEVDCIVSDGMGFIERVFARLDMHGLTTPVIGHSGFNMSYFNLEDRVYAESNKSSVKVAEILTEL